MVNRINEGIKENYLFEDSILVEKQENMKVPLYRKEGQTVVISPKDNEKEHLWACFSDSVNRKIADYIVYKTINHEIVCFIIELKKTKTRNNGASANLQVLSTCPLAKMIYEKITNNNATNLKIIGVKVFGPTAGRNQAKISKKEKGRIDDVDSNCILGIVNHVQNNKNANLASL